MIRRGGRRLSATCFKPSSICRPSSRSRLHSPHPLHDYFASRSVGPRQQRSFVVPRILPSNVNKAAASPTELRLELDLSQSAAAEIEEYFAQADLLAIEESLVMELNSVADHGRRNQLYSLLLQSYFKRYDWRSVERIMAIMLDQNVSLKKRLPRHKVVEALTSIPSVEETEKFLTLLDRLAGSGAHGQEPLPWLCRQVCLRYLEQEKAEAAVTLLLRLHPKNEGIINTQLFRGMLDQLDRIADLEAADKFLQLCQEVGLLSDENALQRAIELGLQRGNMSFVEEKVNMIQEGASDALRGEVVLKLVSAGLVAPAEKLVTQKLPTGSATNSTFLAAKISLHHSKGELDALSGILLSTDLPNLREILRRCLDVTGIEEWLLGEFARSADPETKFERYKALLRLYIQNYDVKDVLRLLDAMDREDVRLATPVVGIGPLIQRTSDLSCVEELLLKLGKVSLPGVYADNLVLYWTALCQKLLDAVRVDEAARLNFEFHARHGQWLPSISRLILERIDCIPDMSQLDDILNSFMAAQVLSFKAATLLRIDAAIERGEIVVLRKAISELLSIKPNDYIVGRLLRLLVEKSLLDDAYDLIKWRKTVSAPYAAGILEGLLSFAVATGDEEDVLNVVEQMNQKGWHLHPDLHSRLEEFCRSHHMGIQLPPAAKTKRDDLALAPFALGDDEDRRSVSSDSLQKQLSRLDNCLRGLDGEHARNLVSLLLAIAIRSRDLASTEILLDYIGDSQDKKVFGQLGSFLQGELEDENRLVRLLIPVLTSGKYELPVGLLTTLCSLLSHFPEEMTPERLAVMEGNVSLTDTSFQRRLFDLFAKLRRYDDCCFILEQMVESGKVMDAQNVSTLLDILCLQDEEAPAFIARVRIMVSASPLLRESEGLECLLETLVEKGRIDDILAMVKLLGSLSTSAPVLRSYQAIFGEKDLPPEEASASAAIFFAENPVTDGTLNIILQTLVRQGRLLMFIEIVREAAKRCMFSEESALSLAKLWGNAAFMDNKDALRTALGLLEHHCPFALSEQFYMEVFQECSHQGDIEEAEFVLSTLEDNQLLRSLEPFYKEVIRLRLASKDYQRAYDIMEKLRKTSQTEPDLTSSFPFLQHELRLPYA